MVLNIFLIFFQIPIFLQIPLTKKGNSLSFLSKETKHQSDIFLHIIPLINFDSAGFIDSSDNLFKGNSDTNTCIECILDGIFDILEEESPKTITLTEFSYFKRFYFSRTLEKQEKIKTLIKNGNLEFCIGGSVRLSEQMISYESIISQIAYVSRFLLREFRYLPRSACNLGSHGHSFIYEKFLSESGFDGVFIDNLESSELKDRKLSSQMEFFMEYQDRLINNTIFTHVNYLNNDETVFGDGVYQILWDGIEGDVIQEKMLEYVDWIYQQSKFYQSSQILHQIGGDNKFNDSSSDYIILDFVIKFLNKNYDKFKIKAGYSTPYIYMNELSKEKRDAQKNIYFHSQNIIDSSEFFYNKGENYRAIGLFSNRQWMKGFLKRIWINFEVYKTYLSLNLLETYVLSTNQEDKSSILSNYDREFGIFEKKIMVSLDDKVVSGVIQEFVARKLKADIKDSFVENFENIGNVFAQKYNWKAFQEMSNLSFYDEKMDIENTIYEDLKNGKIALITVFNPSNSRNLILNIKVPNDQIRLIDEDNISLKNDIICDNNTETQSCILYSLVSINQLTFKSYKLIPKQKNIDSEISQQAVFKGFVLKFSKLVSFSVDNDFNKFEYKVCKPREQESYSDSKKYKLVVNEFIQTKQQESDKNIDDEDKEIHVCLTEKFSIDYRFLISKNCVKKGDKCSTKYNFFPNIEEKNEIVNASLYVGHEVFELKLQRENIVTKIRLFKSLPERGLTIETYIEKTSLEADENGKEILLVIKSLEIRNEKVFYTDLNGLIPKKRTIKSYNSNDFASFSNNFYPVTAFSYIEDDKSKIRMTVLNDRTQAVGCLKEGEISLLIYRRLASFTEEKEEDLLEKKIKLKHYLLFNDPDYFPPLYKYLLKDLERPLLKFSGISETENFQKKKTDDIIMMDLPKDLRFSFQIFKSKEILLNLQNINEFEKLKLKFEKENNNFLDKIMKRKLKIMKIVEMNLSGNQFKSQSEKYKLDWVNSTEIDQQSNMVKTFEEKQKNIKEKVEIMDEETFIQIMPLEIRDLQISDGIEYPPSYKEPHEEQFNYSNPLQDNEISKRPTKENDSLPNFGKNPQNYEKKEDKNNQEKKITGNYRKPNNYGNETNPSQTSSTKKDLSKIGKKPIKSNIPPKNLEQNEYNHFLEDSFSKLKLINNQMAIMQAQKNKQSKPFERNENLLEQYKAISYAYSNSQQKIVELEESLRVETINSEEQRAYIEVLKAALESKINDLGLMNFIKETAKYSKTNHLDLFCQFQKLKENIDNQSSQSKSQEFRTMELEAFIESQHNEMSQLKITNQELMDFNGKINNEIESTINGLNILDEENKKLKNEKNHVLDYLDEVTQKCEKLQKALEDSMVRIQEKDDFINNLQREIASLHKHLQVLENNNEKRPAFSKQNDPTLDLVKELEGLKKKYQDLINRSISNVQNNEEFDFLHDENEKLKNTNQALKNELERLQRRKDQSNEKKIPSNEKKDPSEKNESSLTSTQDKINNMGSPYKEKGSNLLDRSFAKESEPFKRENDQLKKENEHLKLQNSHLMKNLEDNQRSKKSFTPDESFRKREFDRDLEKLNTENRDLKRKLLDLQEKANRDLKKSYRKTEESNSFKEEKPDTKENSAKKMRSPGKEDSLAEKDQKNSNILKKSEIENDLIDDLKMRLEREREEKSKEIKEIYDNLSNTRSELREAKGEIASHLLKMENLENDLATSQDLLDKKQKMLEQSNGETSDLKKTIETKTNEINNLNKKNQITKNEIIELQNMMAHWEKQLKTSNSEREGLLKELKDLNEENYRLKGQIKDLNARLEDNKKINGENNEKVKDYENKLKVLQGNMRNIIQGIKRDLFEGKKGKIIKIFDENITIEEIMKEIKENFNALAEENEKLMKSNKELGENLKENEQIQMKKIEDMRNDNVSLYREIEKVTEDNNFLAEELKKLKQENNNLINELDERKFQLEENMNNEILNLEDRLVKITLDKNQFEFLYSICKRFVFNGEVSDLINELKIVLSTFNTYEKQRIALEKLFEDLKNNENDTNLNNSYYEISKRRKLEDYEDQLSEADTNLKIQGSKREILENELFKLENFESNRYRNIGNLEKIHNQLKNEINILNNELDMKEMSRKNMENAYNDLLNDYKRISEDTKKPDFSEKYSEYQIKKETYNKSTMEKYNSFVDTKSNDGKRVEENYKCKI